MNEDIRARLLGGGADRLADLMIEDLLDRPLGDWVEPGPLSGQLAGAIRSALADPTAVRMVREGLERARKRLPEGPAPVPKEVHAALRQALSRPYTPDRELVAKLLDHATIRSFLISLLQDALVGFVQRLRAPGEKLQSVLGGVSSGLGGGLGSGLAGSLGGRFSRLKEGVVGAVGHEVERQIEAKATEFLEAGVQKLVDKAASQICDPSLSHDYASLRVHTLDVLLQTDMKKLERELEKLDPDALLDSLVGTLRALAERDAFPGEIERALEEVLAESEGQPLRALLQGTEAHGIALVRSWMRQRVRAVVETPAFEAWWDEVVEGRPPAP